MLSRFIITIRKNPKSVFWCVSICFTIVFSFAKRFGDDLGSMRVIGGAISDYWNKAIELYATWSSRVLVNFVLYIFTDRNPLLWALYMGVCAFILMYALSALFTNKGSKNANMIIAVLVTAYTFKDINTAGWIATTTTYFGPTAFGFLSLVPIKKIIKNEKFHQYEYLVYTLALIYAANNEQMMLVILGAYFIATVCFLCNKKFRGYLFFQLLLSVASCCFIITCPGNIVRKGVEIRWFPTYGILDRIDKIDLGYSTTMKWLFFENNPFVLYILILFTVLIWKEYKSAVLRSVALFPVILLSLTGPLKPVADYAFPNLNELISDNPSTYGLVTPENQGGVLQFSIYLIWAVLIIIICIEIVMLSRDLKILLSSFVLLGTGLISRMIMGFSPTIYASKYRTCEVLAFCIIAVGCLIYSQYDQIDVFTKKEKKIINYSAQGLLFFNLINLLFLVAA